MLAATFSIFQSVAASKSRAASILTIMRKCITPIPTAALKR